MKKKQDDIVQDDIEEFDGEVTGYAMQAPLPSGKVGFYEPSHGGEEFRSHCKFFYIHERFSKAWHLHILQVDDMLSSSTGHQSFQHAYGPSFGHQHSDNFPPHGDYFPSIHEEYYYPPHHEEEYKASYSKGKGHELSIRDFFEIALTALAFLAFGLFIIQLLMNASVLKLFYLTIWSEKI